MEGYGSQPSQAGYAWIPGATTIGVVCTDGVILASEKRVTYGYLVVSKGVKQLARDLSAICKSSLEKWKHKPTCSAWTLAGESQ
jgi:20S proteasome alpha/beta subunit